MFFNLINLAFVM